MATLKISDLSVGDWVRYDDRICQIAEIYHLTYNIGSKKMTSFPCVTLYYEDDMPTYQESVILKDIRPIPITAELLEKNGFEKNGEYNEWNIGTWRTPYLLGVSLERPAITIKWNGSSVFIDQAKYIHQLQHALRLAGVDKEINL